MTISAKSAQWETEDFAVKIGNQPQRVPAPALMPPYLRHVQVHSQSGLISNVVQSSSSMAAGIGRNNYCMPSLYALHAAALSKPHAVEQLASDLRAYSIDVAVITETHFKRKYCDSIVSIDGYTLYGRDRLRRRGGGVAVYVRFSIQSTVWTYSVDDRQYELLWVRVGETFIAALYHPPKPRYKPACLLEYLESSLTRLVNNNFLNRMLFQDSY
jgi:hypothetical protein